MQRKSSRESKQVIVDLIPMKDEHNLVIGLLEEEKGSPKKTSSKRVIKKAVEELGEGMGRANPPLSSRTYSTWTTPPQR